MLGAGGKGGLRGVDDCPERRAFVPLLQLFLVKMRFLLQLYQLVLRELGLAARR